MHDKRGKTSWISTWNPLLGWVMVLEFYFCLSKIPRNMLAFDRLVSKEKKFLASTDYGLKKLKPNVHY